MTESVLDSTKKLLGLESDYSPFDLDVITHINAAFATLTQLGVGPQQGYKIESSTEVWEDFETDVRILSMVKSYVFKKVKISFDPPTSSFALSSIKEMSSEEEWRLNVQSEESEVPSE